MLENRQIFEERRQTQRASCPSLANRTETSSKHLVTTSYTTVKQVARSIETPQHRQTDARAIDIGPAAATKIVIKSQHTSRCGSDPHAIELLQDNKKRPPFPPCNEKVPLWRPGARKAGIGYQVSRPVRRVFSGVRKKGASVLLEERVADAAPFTRVVPVLLLTDTQPKLQKLGKKTYRILQKHIHAHCRKHMRARTHTHAHVKGTIMAILLFFFVRRLVVVLLY